MFSVFSSIPFQAFLLYNPTVTAVNKRMFFDVLKKTVSKQKIQETGSLHMKEALVVNGGWEGHEPAPKAALVRAWLEAAGFKVKMADSLAAFETENLKNYKLIVPIWSVMAGAVITDTQAAKVVEAVAEGVGVAGFHNGLFSFPGKFEWGFMAGAHWVAHPGGGKVKYTVNIKKVTGHPVIEGTDDFEFCSEQFYLHTDPAVMVLATTRFPVADGPHAVNGAVDMPVVFVKRWGKGRVSYCSLGHTAAEVEAGPPATLIKRCLLWSAGEL
jgi:type 1 glutamine amidotransferase